MLKKLLPSILLFFSALASAEPIPDFSANYLIRIEGVQAGELKRELETVDNGLRLFQSQTQAKGVFAFFKPEVVTETSLWSRQNDRILPQAYRYIREGGKKDKHMSLDFDWPNKRLYIDDKKKPWSLRLAQPTLDKLLYQLSLMSDLAAGKQRFHYMIADGGKLKRYDIQQIGQESISTPLGNIDTIKLIRKRDRPKDRQTTLWCAPGLHYLPVKLEHIEKDGTVFTAVLRRLKGIDGQNSFHTPTQQ